jgi:methylmalonyl-CoA/ethylmalonyl-CoA epimerase
LELGRQHLTALLPIVSCGEEFKDEGLKVYIQFLRDESGVLYELIAPLGEDSPTAGVLATGKNILNHVAYTVTDLEGESQRLRKGGCIPLGRSAPALAFERRNVAFFLTPLTFILELIEEPAITSRKTD